MRIVFIGASGHGKVCAEIAELNGYDDVLFLDDNMEIMTCGAYPVVGAKSGFKKFADENTEFFASIGKCETRKRILKEIVVAGGKIATLIHPVAAVSKNVEIGAGSVVMAGVVINSGAVIGEGVIVNTGSSVDHDCEIGSYSHIAVGAHLCGTVTIGKGCWIGAGAVVSNNVEICRGCMVGAGAVVVEDIKKVGIYVGVPARKKKHRCCIHF